MAPEINSLSSESNVFHHLYEQARLLYNFASLMTISQQPQKLQRTGSDFNYDRGPSVSRYYGTPGIGVSELGRLNLKTRGAISQMVKKLDKAGMITKIL
mgnify:CR=1 FL=1